METLKETTGKNLQQSLINLQKFMHEEIATYNKPDVALSMSLMTYLCASMLIAYQTLANLTDEELLAEHTNQLLHAMQRMNTARPDTTSH